MNPDRNNIHYPFLISNHIFLKLDASAAEILQTPGESAAPLPFSLIFQSQFRQEIFPAIRTMPQSLYLPLSSLFHPLCYVPHPNIAPSLPEMALLNFAIHLPATDRYLLPMKYTGFALMVINFLRLSSSGCTQMAEFQNGLDISIGNFVPSQSNPNTVLPVPPHRFLPRSESDTPHSV